MSRFHRGRGPASLSRFHLGRWPSGLSRLHLGWRSAGLTINEIPGVHLGGRSPGLTRFQLGRRAPCLTSDEIVATRLQRGRGAPSLALGEVIARHHFDGEAICLLHQAPRTTVESRVRGDGFRDLDAWWKVAAGIRRLVVGTERPVPRMGKDRCRGGQKAEKGCRDHGKANETA